jgi:hypothetical protein
LPDTAAAATSPSATIEALEPSPRSRGIRSLNVKLQPSGETSFANAWTPR